MYIGEKLKRGDRMKKVRRVLITLFVTTSVFATSVFAAPTVGEITQQKNQAESEMKSLQSEMTTLMTEMNLIEQQLIEKGEAIIAATEQLEEAKENEERQHESMMKRIVTMYENGNDSFLTAVLESRNIADFFQRIENVQVLHEYDRGELKKFVETKKEVEELKITLESEQEDLKQLRTQLSSKKASLTSKINEKKNQISGFETQLQEAARKAAEEAAAKRREEEAQKNQQVVVGGNSNSGGGRDYTGTGDRTVGDAIVAAARTYIGVWYVWGGNGYNGIDCSGLTKAAHKAVGITIDRWSGHQAIGGKEINGLANALPGDIICYPGHVAIYIGNYRVIHAPTEGQKVKEASVYMGGTMEITTIRRYW